MQNVCTACKVALVPMIKMKCFDCAAEAAMHPAAKEVKANTKTRSDGDKGNSKPIARNKGKAKEEQWPKLL